MADKETRRFVRAKLRKMNQIKYEVNLYEEAIKSPWREPDENIGGGRSNKFYSQPESIAIAKLSNKELVQRLKLLNAINHTLNTSIPEAEKIIHLRYANNYSWEKIALQVHYSERKCRGIEEGVVDRIANLMGW